MTNTHRTAARAAQATFDSMTTSDRWLGFGYLGERRNALDSSDPECPARPELVAQTDIAIYELTLEQGWTDDDLLTWAISREGRYFADVIFGGTGSFEERLARARTFGYLRKVAR